MRKYSFSGMTISCDLLDLAEARLFALIGLIQKRRASAGRKFPSRVSSTTRVPRQPRKCIFSLFPSFGGLLACGPNKKAPREVLLSRGRDLASVRASFRLANG